MSENFAAVTPQDVARAIDTVKRLLALGKGLSAITPTPLDDRVVEVAERVVAVVEPFAQEPFVVDVVNFVLDLFKKDDPGAALAKAKAAMG